MKNPKSLKARPDSSNLISQLAGHPSSVAVWGLVAAASISAGCGKSSSSSSFNAPAIAPIVNKALPAALQAASTSAVAAHEDAVDLYAPIHVRTITPGDSPTTEDTAIAAQIQAMFTEYFINAINGSVYQGYLNSIISGIDSRMSGTNSQISTMGSTPSCLSSAVTSENINLSAIDASLNFTMPYMQCSETFTTPAGYSGSGMAFGTDGSNDYSMFLIFVNGAGATLDLSGGFVTSANIINFGSTSATAPETVDGMVMNWSGPLSGSTNNQISVVRFIASPSINSFALFLGANSPTTSGSTTAAGAPGSNNDSYLGSGLRLVSDGVHIYADGLALINPTGSHTYTNFSICLTASTFQIDSTTSDCASLANGYVTSTWGTSLYPGLTTNPNTLPVTPTNINYDTVTGCSLALPSANGGSYTAYTASSTACPTGQNIPGSAQNQDMTAPSTAVLNGIKTLALPSNLTSLSSSSSSSSH